MKLQVRGYGEDMELNLMPLTQLCGYEYRKKDYIITSIEKHFSSSKYQIYEQNLMENILIDGRIPGRKYFNVKVVKSREDLIKNLQLNKTSMVKCYVDKVVQNISCQAEMLKIQQCLEKIFYSLNSGFYEGDSNLQLMYEVSDIFEIVQKCRMSTSNELMLEELDSLILIKEYLGIVEKYQAITGEKTLLVFSDLDHMLSKKEFFEFIEVLTMLLKKSDLWCIVSTSTEGFVCMETDFVEGIHCINELVYSLPELDAIKNYIELKYPIHKVFSEKELCGFLSNVVHRLGLENEHDIVRCMIIERILNQSMCIPMYQEEDVTIIEKKFL